MSFLNRALRAHVTGWHAKRDGVVRARERSALPDPACSPRNAGLLVRCASLLYESISLVPLLFVGGWLFLSLTRDAASPPMRALFQVWLLLVLGAYFVYCWKRGHTLAMRTWRLRLTTVEGAAPSSRQAVARYLLAVLGLGLLGAGFLWALIDPQRQFLHDRLAGTRIVRCEKRSAQRRSSR